jgi:hypothetical protein
MPIMAACQAAKNEMRLEIPPTEVGGIFQSNLHQRCFAFLEYPQRQLGDSSSPASDTNASVLVFRFSNGRWITLACKILVLVV